ncbi:MAG: hypothetical protein H8E72_06610 [Candidatus Marinimicrobia bacterium]|nr:hypothetical protein [Candidatus Neomarinimicrobiota bacterium]
MGCPNDIGLALDELKGINNYKFIRDNESFKIQFNPNILSIGEIIHSIKLAGPFTVLEINEAK